MTVLYRLLATPRTIELYAHFVPPIMTLKFLNDLMVWLMKCLVKLLLAMSLMYVMVLLLPVTTLVMALRVGVLLRLPMMM